jgi:hypothetical protein
MGGFFLKVIRVIDIGILLVLAYWLFKPSTSRRRFPYRSRSRVMLAPSSLSLFSMFSYPPVNVVDAVDEGLAAGDECGQYEGGAGSEVGCLDGGSAEVAGVSGDNGLLAVDADVGAHATEFEDVHEAVLEDGFLDERDSASLGHQGHELCLEVGGKAGEFLGGCVDGTQFRAGAGRGGRRA